MAAADIVLIHSYSATSSHGAKMIYRLTVFTVFCFLNLLAFNAVIAGTVSYQYDTLDRLTRMEQQDGTVLVYEYDNSGNRKVKTATITDTDNDGIPDNIENNCCTDAYDADTDDDGLSDGTEDSNHNGLQDPTETDPCNIDTDGDGIQDGTEKGITASVPDPDGSGPLLGTDTTIFQPDLDPQTTTDALLVDSDGDGLADGVEDANRNGRLDPGESDPAGTAFTVITPILFLLFDE